MYSLRKKPLQARSKASVDAILQAATQLLLLQGYDKANTNKIAELAGVSIGSLYEYFPGKEAIYAEIRRREDQRHFKLIMAEPIPTTLVEMLRLHVSTYLKLIRTNLELHSALNREVPQFAVVDSESAELNNYLPHANDFLQSRNEELKPQCEIPVITELLSRVVKGTINDYILHAPERLKDSTVSEELLKMLERYLLHDK